MELSELIDEILFVIVLYERKAEASQAYNGIRKLGELTRNPVSVFLYDNSPESSRPDDTTVIYRHDPENSGVSKAYNEGFIIASGLKKKWLLLLDQDTLFERAFIVKLPESLQKNNGSVAFVPVLFDKHGVVSPFRWWLGRGIRTTAVIDRLPLSKFRFLNSGLLIKCEAFKNTGGYPESVPFDFSDIAFGEVLKKVTDHFIVVKISMQHSFSGSEKMSCDAAAHRYVYFCKGAFAMGQTFGPRALYIFNALLRGLNLSVQYKNIIFLRTFFKQL
jgi:GT2 family glycosyltransferase